MAYKRLDSGEEPKWQGPETPECRSAEYDDSTLARLREREQLWLQWVSLLHDHHAKLGTEQSRIVLEIAKRRWLEARTAVKRHLEGG